jgi:hypothetical protein
MTITQLKDALDRLHVSAERYDLAGGIPTRSEGLVLVQERDRWLIRHFERGSWYTLAQCGTEDDACLRLLTYAADPFYRT